MFRALNADNEFVSFGTYVGVDDKIFAVTPNNERICKDDRGGEFELVHVSHRHSYRMFRVTREIPEVVHVVPDQFPSDMLSSPCVVGDTLTMGFLHWVVRADDACVLRFVQTADPRKNGMPVVSRKHGTFMGMYCVKDWFEGSSCVVPCDLFRENAVLPDDLEFRTNDLAKENQRNVTDTRSSNLPARAIELDDRIVVETRDGRAKWVGDVKPRRVIREREERHVRASFKDLVRDIERGETRVRWDDDVVMTIRNPPQTHGFTLRMSYADASSNKADAAAPRTSDAAEEEDEFPCESWKD